MLRQENRAVKRTAKDRLAAELQALGVQLKAAEEKEREARESFAAAEAELKAEAHRAKRLQAQMQEQAEALAALRRETGGGAEGPVGPSLPDTPRPQPKGIRELQEEKLSSWRPRKRRLPGEAPPLGPGQPPSRAVFFPAVCP